MNGMQEIPQEKYNLSLEQEWKRVKEYHQAFHTAIIETLRTFLDDVIYIESWCPKYENRQTVKHWFNE